MTDIPITFNEVGVCDLLAGRRTQTRALVSRTEQASPFGPTGGGARLWVRETWLWVPRVRRSSRPPWPDIPHVAHNGGWAFYRAGFNRTPPSRWTASTRMPRGVSRITLRTKSVTTEHVQSMNDDDARASGFYCREAFAENWDTMYQNRRARPAGWSINPLVWRCVFEVDAT